MQPRLARYAFSATVLGALTLPASAQWSENFDSYASGTIIEGIAANQWDNWVGTPQPYSTVENDPAAGATDKAGCIVGSLAAACGSCSDTVNYLGTGAAGSPYNSGAWVMTTDVYVPSAFNERSYFIMLSEFGTAGGSTINWNVQMYFDGPTASCDADNPNTCAPGVGNCMGAQILQYDTWVPVRVELDLNAAPGTPDSCVVYYNNVPMYEYGWAEGVFGNNANAQTPSLRAIDLFPAGDLATAVYYDDMDLSPGISGGPLGTSYCNANVNSTGLAGSIAANGDIVAANNSVTLTASNLPPGQAGIFIWSPNQGFVPTPGGSQGNLCLSAPIGRYNIPSGYGVLVANGAGEFQLSPDLTNTPTPTGPTALTAGMTANFQAWFRDQNPSNTSNFTDGRTITFQ